MERELSIFRNVDEARRVTDTLGEARKSLESLVAQWEEISRAIEEAKS